MLRFWPPTPRSTGRPGGGGDRGEEPASGAGRRDGVWWAALGVAGAAAAATAHGLYAVAAASGVPWPMAALYPVMADGLALVAYAATSRLDGAGRRYAWTVVVTAAGSSGAAQAAYLAGGGVAGSPAAVRFGIGAAPAVAAAAVAHLVHLIRTSSRVVRLDSRTTAVQSAPAVRAARPVGERPGADAARPERPPAGGVRPSTPDLAPRSGAAGPADPGGAAARAAAAALDHRSRHGRLPTVTQLVHAASVSRGTAGTVLKGLRSTATGRPDRPSPTEAASDSPQPPDQSRTSPVDQPSRRPIKITDHHTPMHHDPQGSRTDPATVTVR